MNTKMFFKITEKIAETRIIDKESLIISGLGILPKDLKEYFRKTLIKRNRAIVDMKKIVAKTIIEIHNKKYRKNKDLCYTLTDIANVLDIKSHSSVLFYFRNEKVDDELSLFIKNNFIRWINDKKYPMPFVEKNEKYFYVLLKENELDNLKLTSTMKIKSEDFNQLVNLKKREHFIGS